METGGLAELCSAVQASAWRTCASCPSALSSEKSRSGSTPGNREKESCASQHHFAFRSLLPKPFSCPTLLLQVVPSPSSHHHFIFFLLRCFCHPVQGQEKDARSHVVLHLGSQNTLPTCALLKPSTSHHLLQGRRLPQVTLLSWVVGLSPWETRIDPAGWQLEERKGGTACGEFPVWGEGRASGMAVLAGMCCHLSLWEDICASPPAPRGLHVNLGNGENDERGPGPLLQGSPPPMPKRLIQEQ